MKEKKTHNEVDRYYRGLRYVVRLLDRGYRCGYVQIPEDSWENVKADEGNRLLCHGGVTYCGTVEEDNVMGLPPGHWVGFDCHHAEDTLDVDSVKKVFNKEIHTPEWSWGAFSHMWTSEEVEEDCKDIINQYWHCLRCRNFKKEDVHDQV